MSGLRRFAKSVGFQPVGYALTLCLGLILGGSTARAQTAEQLTESRLQVDTGTDHFRAGRYEKAVLEFRKALTVIQEAGLVWNIARSYEELGDNRNAIHYFETFIKDYPKDPSAQEAATRVASLRRLLPGSLVVTCGDVVGAKVLLDGETEAKCGRRVSNLEPGRHLLEVRAVGRATWKQEVTIAPDERLEVVADWRAAEAAAEEAAANGAQKVAAGIERVPSSPGAAAPGRVGGVNWGVITLVGAAGFLGVGALFGHLGETARNNYEDAKLAGPNDNREVLYSDIVEYEDQASSYPMIANTLFGVGAITGAIGTYLLLQGPGENTGVWMTAIPGGGGIRVGLPW